MSILRRFVERKKKRGGGFRRSGAGAATSNIEEGRCGDGMGRYKLQDRVSDGVIN